MCAIKMTFFQIPLQTLGELYFFKWILLFRAVLDAQQHWGKSTEISRILPALTRAQPPPLSTGALTGTACFLALVRVGSTASAPRLCRSPPQRTFPGRECRPSHLPISPTTQQERFLLSCTTCPRKHTPM